LIKKVRPYEFLKANNFYTIYQYYQFSLGKIIIVQDSTVLSMVEMTLYKHERRNMGSRVSCCSNNTIQKNCNTHNVCQLAESEARSVAGGKWEM